MAIGILSLAIGAICIAVSSAGIKEVEHPARETKTVVYPYPREI